MAETVRLVLFAVLLAGGLVIEITAVFGANRFRFSLNRMHPAGMGDTLGLLLMTLAMIVVRETEEEQLKTEAKEWKS